MTDLDIGPPYPNRFSGVVQFDIDPISGQLSLKDPAAVSTGPYQNVENPTPGAATLTSDGKNVYVLNNGYTPNDRIAQFDVDATTGKLSPKNPASVATGPIATFMVVTPDSTSAYVSSFGPAATPGPTPDPDGPGAIWQYDIDPATGALAPKSPPTVETDGNPAGSAVTPDGRTAYVTDPPRSDQTLRRRSGKRHAHSQGEVQHHHRRQSRRIVLGPLPRVPTAKAHCQRSGWRDFGQFKNQGHCVAFVVRSSH